MNAKVSTMEYVQSVVVSFVGWIRIVKVDDFGCVRIQVATTAHGSPMGVLTGIAGTGRDVLYIV